MSRRPVSLIVLGILGLLSAHTVLAAERFAAPAFAQRWQQDEQRVTNFWGPLALAHPGQYESYVYSQTCPPQEPGQPLHPCDSLVTPAQRLVQYFDKGRMELNDTPPAATTVTSGLLVREMVTGKLQLGDNRFEQRPAAAIPVAGDPDNTFPLYRDLLSGPGTSAPAAAGSSVNSVYGPGGTSTATAPSGNPATQITQTDPQTNHAVPQVFADFRARVGVDVVGLAVTEPFYADVRVAGVQRRILIQAFERRVLTYNAANPPEFQVEFGNVGQQYYRWRYGG